MSGRQTLRVRCAHNECTETAFWDGMTHEGRARQARHLKERPWCCTRHARPDEVIGTDNPSRDIVVTAERSKRYPELTKLFWRQEGAADVGSGFLFGPGFKAFADDFAEGARLTITVTLFAAEADGLVEPEPMRPEQNRSSS